MNEPGPSAIVADHPISVKLFHMLHLLNKLNLYDFSLCSNIVVFLKVFNQILSTFRKSNGQIARFSRFDGSEELCMVSLTKGCNMPINDGT